MDNNSAGEKIILGICFFLITTSILSFVAGIGLYAYEKFYWLQYSIDLTFLDMLSRTDAYRVIEQSAWIQNPDSWHGLHVLVMKILNYSSSFILLMFSGSLALILIGLDKIPIKRKS